MAPVSAPVLTGVSVSFSAGCFFTGEVRAPSTASEAESDIDRALTDGPGLVCSAAPDSAHPSEPAADIPKPRIPKVTSDSFISELVSDREPGKAPRESHPPPAPVLEEELVPGEETLSEVALSPSQSGGALGSQWSNVDLEEGQSLQIQGALVPECAETSSLSSVVTYTLAMEDPDTHDDQPLWAWVSAGACNVDCHSQLNWFNCSLTTSCE